MNLFKKLQLTIALLNIVSTAADNIEKARQDDDRIDAEEALEIIQTLSGQILEALRSEVGGLPVVKEPEDDDSELPRSKMIF